MQADLKPERCRRLIAKSHIAKVETAEHCRESQEAISRSMALIKHVARLRSLLLDPSTPQERA
ncbi:MAG: hypothetical protein JOZ16_17130 [Methylobacteriaceae bacterium]|nr:hypothetical protein [Methylobacteriaceae bacterium]